MLIIGVVLLSLSLLVALLNAAGCISAWLGARRGSTRGYSCMPLVGFVFALIGTWLARERLGFWPLLVTLGDMGTWAVLIALGEALWRKR